jgi:hypothetical protein
MYDEASKQGFSRSNATTEGPSELPHIKSWHPSRLRTGLSNRLNLVAGLRTFGKVRQMKRYDLSQHAKDVIAGRNIRLPWLEQVLESPELVEPDRDDPELTHYMGRIKEHGNRALRVVFNKSVNPVRIVTVYFDREMKGRL